MSRRVRILIAVLVLGLLGSVGVAVDATIVEPNRLVTHRVDLAVDPWSHDLDGLKVALFSDLHAGSPFVGLDKVDSVVKAVERTHPDIVVLAGDYTIGGVRLGHYLTPEEIGRRLAKLHAPLGVWAVLGNHDWWNGGDEAQRALEDAGIHVLDDASALAGRGLYVAGVADWASGRQDPAAALEHVPPGAPVITIVHNPDAFPLLRPDVSLTLAGHTHGGQIAPFSCPVGPSGSRYGTKYLKGHVLENGKDLFVTTGIGTSIVPVRLGVTPEIALLTLRTA